MTDQESTGKAGQPEEEKEKVEPEQAEAESAPEAEEEKPKETEASARAEEVLEQPPEPPAPEEPPSEEAPEEQPLGYEVKVEELPKEEGPFNPIEVFKDLSSWNRASTVAALIVFLCAILPWRITQTATRPGIATSMGLLCFLLSIATVLILAATTFEKFAAFKKLMTYVVFVTGGLIAILAFVDIIGGRANGVGAGASFLAGLVICFANYMAMMEQKPAE